MQSLMYNISTFCIHCTSAPKLKQLCHNSGKLIIIHYSVKLKPVPVVSAKSIHIGASLLQDKLQLALHCN